MNHELNKIITKEKLSNNDHVESELPTITSTDAGRMILKLPSEPKSLESTNVKRKEFKIKRPKNVVSEEEYNNNLEEIITRDYFSAPGTPSSSNPTSKSSYSSLSLDQYQAKFTSEDNDSFNSLLEGEINNQRKKYSWIKNNKVYSEYVKTIENTLQHEHNKLLTSSLSTPDNKPPNNPKNQLMFPPEGTGERIIRAQNSKLILRDNTKISTKPPSKSPPKLSSFSLQPSSGPPTINSYSMVTENTYKLPSLSNREHLHEDLIAKSKKKSNQLNSNLSFNSKTGRITKTPLNQHVPSTPLSPAASRLMSKMDKRNLKNFSITPNRKNK